MLHYVFRKKKSKNTRQNMLQEFITSALIIDDSKKEIEKLKEYLDDKDIWVKHYTPDEIEGYDKDKLPFNNRKLIFLDLYLDDKDTLENNIAKIRSYFANILGNDFGTYGIILWTKHAEEFESFVERIYKTANKYTTPLFVLHLEKNKYLQKDDYNGILEELEEKLQTDTSSSFFIEWNKAVKKGSDNTISNLYNLFDTNEKKNKHLEPVLYKLACNYTGIPEENINEYNLQKDLVKSLMDSLQFEISENYQAIEKLFSEPERLNYSDTTEEKKKAFSKLNSLLLLDFQNLAQNFVLPGNIYEIQTTESLLSINEVFYKENKKTKKLVLNDESDVKVNKRIIIEITPPCDFAQNKKQSLSRVLGGIIIDDDKSNQYFNGDSYYSYLHPVSIKGLDKPQKIIFDFYRFKTINEDELKDDLKYKIIARAKDKLFADILQKLSSHTARLGIAIMYP